MSVVSSFFFFSSRRRHTRFDCDWSSDVCSSDLTITTGLFAGLDRATAARYAFLLGIPITAGAGMKEALHLIRAGERVGDTGPILVALLVSFLAGWFAVWFLVNYLKRRSLLPVIIHRLALAAVIVAVWYR